MTTVIMFKLKHSASLSAGMPQEGKLYLCNRATGMVAGALLCSFTLKAFLRFSFYTSLTLLSALPCSAHERSLL